MQTKKIGILGIGNLLLQDEGFGVSCVEELEKQYQIPEDVEVVDGGTAGIMLASFMEEVEILFVLDSVNLDDEPGSIHIFTDADVRAGNIQSRMSPHQIGLLEVLEICRLREQAPERVEMITAVPKELSPRIGLTPELEGAVGKVLEILVNRLKEYGVQLKEKETETNA